MRIPAAEVKQAIVHANQDVRSLAVRYFADASSSDADVMPLVIQAIEKYGRQEAFEHYSSLEDLVQTEPTLDWLIRQVESTAPEEEEDELSWRYAYLDAISAAPAALLQARLERIGGLLDEAGRRRIEQTVEFASRPPEDLWRELESFCREHDAHLHDEKHTVPEDGLDRMDQLSLALAPHGDRLADRVLAILMSGDEAGYWQQGYAIRAAGAMRLGQGAGRMVELLAGDGDDWYSEECERALARIGGDEVVAQIVERHADARSSFSISAGYVLERVHTDASVRAALDLAAREADPEHKRWLLNAALLNLDSDALEPARQFILATPLDPELAETRATLLTVSKLLGQTFPEYEAWKADAQNDREFRRTWYQEHYPALGGIARWLEQGQAEENEQEDEDEGVEEEEEEVGMGGADHEPPLPHPDTYVHFDARVGRNDPCPCGSGKKFKKCCMRTATR